MASYRHRRHHRKKSKGGVELNLAAMLDMAFQLLTFFILTFRPAPVEGQLSLNMPPATQFTPAADPAQVQPGQGNASPPGIETLHMFVVANEKGDASEVKIEKNVVAKGLGEKSLAQVGARLKSIFDGGASFDRVQIAVDRNLRYDELMRLIDTCTQQKIGGKPLQKISFVELGAQGGS